MTLLFWQLERMRERDYSYSLRTFGTVDGIEGLHTLKGLEVTQNMHGTKQNTDVAYYFEYLLET